jgi:hypothetical protein
MLWGNVMEIVLPERDILHALTVCVEIYFPCFDITFLKLIRREILPLNKLVSLFIYAKTEMKINVQSEGISCKLKLLLTKY